MPLLRVPYTDPFPLPKILPATANTTSGAVAALVDFLSSARAPSTTASSSARFRPNFASPTTTTTTTTTTSTNRGDGTGKTLLLTGAGISVASGLADYRGANGTYTLNKSYRPIYYSEFCESHAARKRYWARSFLGWTNLQRARPNAAHWAVGRLGELGVCGGVVTQNVDSFHPLAHPSLPTIELHGYLRSLTCTTCHTPYPRSAFQTRLAALNPTWAAFLAELLASGALDTEDPAQRRKKGFTTNPDGDAEVPGAEYTTFRYPPCGACLEATTTTKGGGKAGGGSGTVVNVRVDQDGAWQPGSTGGVLKPAVVMFGEAIPGATKVAAEQAVDAAGRLLVVGSSLATYSAWRLVKRARERGVPIAVVNIGGVRGEEEVFEGVGMGGRDGRLQLSPASVFSHYTRHRLDSKARDASILEIDADWSLY
ncbi:DHS-like NAD/FAD-binding domain-containing protein [Massariosphaeria phaeospora]|uniref:DHS-like NAD/FAD-binding domain-containing protein n=1 Tax=Massariosphaeria phaeospora TaxID=100035 RepID=A0A7C8I7P0_9PLEO|nr:DHS-like NAD/FAD-binding domain-containing protein [Massariosphaeria phaeospora]